MSLALVDAVFQSSKGVGSFAAEFLAVKMHLFFFLGPLRTWSWLATLNSSGLSIWAGRRFARRASRRLSRRARLRVVSA